MPMMTGVLEQLLASLQGVLDHIATQVSLLVMALALIVFTIRLVSILFKEGYDRFVPQFREHLLKFMVILGLCLPISIPPMSGNSVITAFPKLIIFSGFSTADQLMGSIPSAAKGDGTLAGMPVGLTAKLREIRGEEPFNFEDMITKAGQIAKAMLPAVDAFDTLTVLWKGNGLKVLFYAIGIIIVMIPVGVVLWLVGGPFALPILVMMGAMALGMLASVADLGTVAAGDTSLAQDLLKTITRTMADYIFVSVLTFSFYGVLFSAIIKGTIYAITFPISIVTLPFESQKGHFYSHVVRSFQLALTPVLAAVIFAVALYGYAFITKAGGPFDQMINVFVDRGSVPGGGFWEFVMYFFRWIFAILVAPIAMAATIAKYMLQVPRIASELIGTGITYSSGMAETMSGMGGGGKR